MAAQKRLCFQALVCSAILVSASGFAQATETKSETENLEPSGSSVSDTALPRNSSEDLQSWTKLYDIARSSLEDNIFHLQSGNYLAAGQHQFKTLWVRDFCFATRGLFELGMDEVVRDQLSTIIQNRRLSDGLVPRDLDSSSPKNRVIAQVMEKLFGIKQNIPLVDPLMPEYVDEHNSPPIDSNALVLLTAYNYVVLTGDMQWWDRNLKSLVQIYRFYNSYRDPADGLIVQPDYSDWQDSTQRHGKTFYTNLIYYLTTFRMSTIPGFNVPEGEPERLRASIEARFFDSKRGIYKSLVRGEAEEFPYISLEGNLLAIDLGYIDPQSDTARALYGNLKKSPLWEGAAGMPGFGTWPDYPEDWVSWTIRMGGVGHYHDRIYWSWLIALSSKVARIMGDGAEADRIMNVLARITVRDGAVTEIYSPEPELPLFNSSLYTSETPFSWGAAFVLDAVANAFGKQPLANPLQASN